MKMSPIILKKSKCFLTADLYIAVTKYFVNGIVMSDLRTNSLV